VNCIFDQYFFVIIGIGIFYCTWCIHKYSFKIMYTNVRILIHSLSCVLKWMFPACRLNFAEVDRATCKIARAFRKWGRLQDGCSWNAHFTKRCVWGSAIQAGWFDEILILFLLSSTQRCYHGLSKFYINDTTFSAWHNPYLLLFFQTLHASIKTIIIFFYSKHQMMIGSIETCLVWKK
jgi:hypothetical protein